MPIGERRLSFPAFSLEKERFPGSVRQHSPMVWGTVRQLYVPFRKNPPLANRMVTTQERGNAWYSMGKLGLAMKNREHLPPAVQKFMEYLPFREMAGRRMPVNERGRAVLFFGL